MFNILNGGLDFRICPSSWTLAVQDFGRVHIFERLAPKIYRHPYDGVSVLFMLT